MGRARLVPHQNVADPLLAEQRVIDRQHRATGIAEDEFHALPHQAFDQNIGAAALLAHRPDSFHTRAGPANSRPARCAHSPIAALS